MTANKKANKTLGIIKRIFIDKDKKNVEIIYYTIYYIYYIIIQLL